ncbi:MAG: pyruvate, water dikinase, partial [Thermoplasmatales archaeon]
MVTQILKEEGILPLIKVRKEMIELAGGKGANLGELLSQGIRVPPGFVITSKAYSYFLDYNGLREKIISALNLSPDEASKVIKNLILSAKLPLDLEEMINSSYNELANMAGKEVLVAVRSSATAEDIENASFAGQQDTYLNVNRSNIIEAVKLVWASLYNERAIEYRKSKGIDSSKVEMAVVVQKMVNSKSSGVMFTLNPSNGDRNLIVIESSWGLGEAVVGGKVTPDEIVISKSNLKILDKRISKKNLKIVYDKGRNIEVHLEGEESEKPSISDEEALELAKLALKIEAHYGTPMDIEWAIDSDLKFPDNVFIVQARPETFWSSRKKEDVKVEEKPSERKVLVKGLAASPGIASGKARVLLDVKDAKEFQKGEILVTKMTDPDWVPVMKAASAIVTDEGGITSHAAIVSRELGIPAIVGAKEATKVLETGQEITVDATRGVVYDGKIILEEPKQESHTSTGSLGLSRDAMLSLFPVTGTKIYMNLGQPDVIEKYLDLPFDGIGLMRIEFIVSEWIKHHPLYLIKIGKPEEFVNKLADGIARVASAIYPRPVVVRFSDFKTNEYRGLIGGEEFEPEERNPMIGWRGVSRYVSQQYEPAFRLEVRAIRKAREDMGLKNVWVMFPFVRT